MKVELKSEPTFAACHRVACNLRDRDRKELFATSWRNDPAELARDATMTGAFRWAAYLDGTPVALIGAMPRWPGVWSAWAYGTDDWHHVVGALSRHVRRFMLPALFNAGAHRVDAFALAEHEDARKWLSFLGAEQQNTLDKWGKNGETFVCYVWTREKTKRLIDKIDSRTQNAQR